MPSAEQFKQCIREITYAHSILYIHMHTLSYVIKHFLIRAVTFYLRLGSAKLFSKVEIFCFNSFLLVLIWTTTRSCFTRHYIQLKGPPPDPTSSFFAFPCHAKNYKMWQNLTKNDKICWWNCKMWRTISKIWRNMARHWQISARFGGKMRNFARIWQNTAKFGEILRKMAKFGEIF